MVRSVRRPSRPRDPTQSLERLQGQRWPEPPEDATSLVRAVHALRRRPVGDLRPEELARLITQDVGLPWLLPLAVRILRDTAPSQIAGGLVRRRPSVRGGDAEGAGVGTVPGVLARQGGGRGAAVLVKRRSVHLTVRDALEGWWLRAGDDSLLRRLGP
ncbi:contact-dependent growth inhibition system immunity protein [Streptomyces pseudogriseolus]|uniref:contact-dependent growth inhibition system immunity protein n=1 Tax=Streptomyces pseudogriseolus TaxID=36817 RepID=UPI000349FE5E